MTKLDWLKQNFKMETFECKRLRWKEQMLLRMQAWHDACRMRAHADDITVQRYQPV